MAFHSMTTVTTTTKSFDDLDLQPSSLDFSRKQSLRGSRKSLKSVGSEDDILIKVGEIEHKDPFKKLQSEDGGHFAARKLTKVTKLVRQKSSTSLNTDSEPNDNDWSDDEDDDGLKDFILEISQKKRVEQEVELEQKRREDYERETARRQQEELELERKRLEELEIERRQQETYRLEVERKRQLELEIEIRKQEELERERQQIELLEIERKKREALELELTWKREEELELERRKREAFELELARKKREEHERETAERLRAEQEQHLSMQETLEKIGEEHQTSPTGGASFSIEITKEIKTQITTEEQNKSTDHSRFSFASSADTVREVKDSEEFDVSRSGSLKKRKMSSVTNPDYYNYAWKSIRDKDDKDDKEHSEEYWRVLQDRGLMSSDNYNDYVPEDAYNQRNQTVTTVTKVITNREIQQANPQLTPNTSQSYVNYTYQEQDSFPRQPASPRSPVGSHRDAPTPTQPPPQEGYYSAGRDAAYDSFEQQQSFRQDYQDYNGRVESPPSQPPPIHDNPPYQNGPYGSYNNISPGAQSPRQPNPDDSFHGSQQPEDPYRRHGDYQTTTTVTTDHRLQSDLYNQRQTDDRPSDYAPSDQGRRDQYGGSTTITERLEERQYSSGHLNQDLNNPRDLSDRPMDSPRSDRFSERGPYGSQPRLEAPMLGAPPMEKDRRSPSINSTSRGMDIRWRNPDLPEVIEYLSHHNDMVKANAAAYLQHLCYMDDDTKAKTRGLGGIPVLVELVNNDVPEVHRAACGALKNLSYGRANEENKKAIKNAGGIPALVRLLRKTPDTDVRELVTGILWNLSSLKDLKRPIIDDGLTVLVNSVIVPHSGWDPSLPPAERKPTRDIYWSTVFRNASGVLRNVSSDGQYSRTKLRECEGLVDAIVFIVQAAIGKSDIDNKSVENCVCVLRNLSYACQEVQDKQYLSNRAHAKNDKGKGDTTGCFGGNKKKKDPKDSKSRQGVANPNYSNPNEVPRGMGLLWHSTIVPLYLPLLYDCTNPETLEAAAGAIQNLAACDWQPSEEIRETVRKQKGLPVLVELLNLEADKVVCAAATALRNLSQDPQSKELIGKYAMRQLVTRLPEEGRSQQIPNEETICALEALIYEVIKTNLEFATSLLTEGGVDRLMYIVRADKFEYRVRKYASSILTKMWEFKDLHGKYRERGWKDVNFLVKPMDPKKGSPSKSLPSSAENTLNRPRMDQSGPTLPGYNENTLPYISRQPVNNTMAREHPGENHYSVRQERGPHDARYDEIPMTNLAPNHHGAPTGRVPESPNLTYSGVDLSRQDELRRQDDLDQHSDQYNPGNNYGTGRRPVTMDYNPRLEDIDRQSDYSRGPPQHPPSDYGRDNDLNLSRQQDFGPPGGSPRNYRVEGDYTPQGSDYSRRDEYRQGSYREDYPSDPTRRDDYRPPGGVALFPNLGPAPGRHTPQPQDDHSREPLYARVVKQGGRTDSGLVLDGGSPQGGPGGADSWV